MGEEQGSVAPFLFFTDHTSNLANAVREGRRREFAAFPQFSTPDTLARIPDPNDPKTFEDSKPAANPRDAGQWESFYRQLIAIRRAEIIPRLHGARSLDAVAVGPTTVLARWRMNDAAELVVGCNLGERATTISPQSGKLLFATSESAARALMRGSMEPVSTVALLSLA